MIITQDNFDEYFRDVRNHTPEKGDVIARYTAMADFVEGRLKSDIIDLLYNKNKIEPAIQVMKKLGLAVEKDSIRICKEICSDLVSGMSVEDVESKVYSYQLELFYYTKKEYVPIDPHWSVISINNLDEFLDQAGNKITIKTKYLEGENEENDGHTVY